MNRKSCREIRLYIDELESGQQLDEGAQAHLEVCSGCKHFRSERGSLRDLIGSLDPVAAPADFEIRLRARMAATERKPRQFSIFPFAVSMPALATAALVVIAIVSLVWFTQRNARRPVHTASEVASTIHSAAPAAVNSTGADKTIVPDNSDELVATASQPPAKLSRRRVDNGATRTRDFNLGSAFVFKQGDANQVLVSAPRQPLVISLEDERGMTRKISLPPVSFGSQSLVDNRVPVSSTNGRVW